TLTVTAATPSLNGAKYRCLVTNSAGSALSNTATLSVDGTFTVLHAFAGSPDGYWPVSLVQATDGSFYGSTSFGGSTLCSSGCGTIFRMNAAGATSTLYAFSTGSVGTHPNGGLM